MGWNSIPQFKSPAQEKMRGFAHYGSNDDMQRRNARPEFAAPGFEQAGHRSLFLRRVSAYVLDCAMLFGILGPLGFLIQSSVGIQPATGLQLWLTIVLNFSAPTWCYFALSDSSQGGATLGKWVLGLRVSAADGSRLKPSKALLRTFVKLIPWELSHLAWLAAFSVGALAWVFQIAMLAASGAVAVTYLIITCRHGGRFAYHDLRAGTQVEVG